MFEGGGGDRWAVEVDEEVHSGMVTRGERGRWGRTVMAVWSFDSTMSRVVC